MTVHGVADTLEGLHAERGIHGCRTRGPQRGLRPSMARAGVCLIAGSLLTSCDGGKNPAPAVTAEAAAVATASAALVGVVTDFATALAAQLPATSDLVATKELGRKLAAEPGLSEQMRSAARSYALVAEAARRALEDDQRAAHQVTVLVESVVAGLHSDPNAGSKAAPDVLDDLTGGLDQSFKSEEFGNRQQFLNVLEDTLSTVAAIALYVQVDPSGRHVIRERFQDMTVPDPPSSLANENGDLRLAPFGPEVVTALDGWLKPTDGKNDLFEVAHAWVMAEEGLYQAFDEAVGRVLY